MLTNSVRVVRDRLDSRLLLVGSNGEAYASAATTVLKNLLATLGAVALAEAMGAESAGVAGLKSSL